MSAKSSLKANVLVLNQSWNPVNITNVEDAIGLIFKGKAKIIVHKDLQDIFGKNAAYKYEALTYEQWINRSEILSEEYDFIRSPKHRHLKPTVILLDKYKGFPNYRIKLSRKAVYNRDNGQCQYCSAAVPYHLFQVEHIIPKSKGGKYTWNNICVSCGKCNGKKRDRTPAEAGMKLLHKPVRPDETNFANIYSKENEYWSDFLMNSGKK
jgi:5-methylcytosine-specific restriction endonuclease McrA